MSSKTDDDGRHAVSKVRRAVIVKVAIYGRK